MTDAKLKAKVAEAVVLDRQRAEIDRRLKEIKAMLIQEAEGRIDESVPTANGGQSIRFDGADGCIATVSFPARTLKANIAGEGKTFDKIKAIVGSAMNRLFTPAVAYKPIQDFRAEAERILGRAGGRLIKLCESESSPRVNFETANRETE